MQKIATGFGGEVKLDRDIQWVLTVPAIWNEFGKAFMRKAAFKAGMIETEQSHDLILVLEPEGASLAVHVGAAQFGLLGVASRFMVLDCGGGTVDITVHEGEKVEPSLSMKAIAPPTGGNWGGDYVNVKFQEFLKELLGPDLYKPTELPLEFYSINAEFDKNKIMFDPSSEPARIRLADILEQRSQLIELAATWNRNHPYIPIDLKPSTRNGFLSMSNALMTSFFEPFLAATVDETRRVLKHIPGIQCIMVVGGFGSSKILIERIQKEFHGKDGVQVICPDASPKPQEAILRGAVHFGLNKGTISSRITGSG